MLLSNGRGGGRHFVFWPGYSPFLKLGHISNAQETTLISFTPLFLAELEPNDHCIKKHWGKKDAVTTSAI